MEKDAKKKETKKTVQKQLNDTFIEDRVQIYVDTDMNELDKVASKKRVTKFNIYLIISLVIFVGVLISSTTQIYNYIERRKIFDETNKIVEISSKDDKLSISNNGSVHSYNQKSLINTDSDEAVVENISKLKLVVDESAKEKSIHKYNVRYRINQNDYKYLSVVTDPELYVRFAYSSDQETWNYVNNAISTTNSTLMPQMGNYYDISGLETTLNVATNFELIGKPGETVYVYWKSETVYRHITHEENKTADKELDATFNVEYAY